MIFFPPFCIKMCSPHFASCRGSYSPPLPWKPLCAQQCSVGDQQLQTWAPPSQLGPAAQCVPAKCCGCRNFPLLHLSDCLEEQRRLCQGEERSQERIPAGSCCRAGSPVALPHCFPCKPLQILICCISPSAPPGHCQQQGRCISLCPFQNESLRV